MKNSFQKIGRRELIICLCLVSACLLVYWQVQHNDFINYDDELYVTQNPHVTQGLTGENMVWAFSSGYATNWHPLTWLSHMLDCELYGLNPRGHHWTNLQIHVANTLLLFLIFNWMTGALWPSSFVAAMFALHPLHVESVAWIAERKDVLSTFFWMLSIWAYVRYVRRPAVKGYLVLILFYTLGLMSKPMVVTLPFVLLLLDFWPLARLDFTNFRRQGSGRKKVASLFYEKLPLFAFSAISSGITFFVQQHGGAVASLESLPFKIRIVNVWISYLRYLIKMIWPRNLAVFYPFPQWPVEYAVVSALVIVGVSLLVVRAASRHPYLLTGWFWYLVTLFPVIGLIHVGSQSMADRYSYIPLTGIFILTAWGIADLSKQMRHRRMVLATSAGAVLIAYMICTWFQVGYWQNSITLFTHALDVTQHNSVAYFSLGQALDKQGQFEKAIENYRKSLEITPHYKNAHNNIGFILARRGNLQAAIDQYSAELMYFPDNADAHNNMANALFDQGRIDEAASQYLQALQIDPEHANAHYNFGHLLLRQGKYKDAMIHSAQAIRINPGFAAAYNQIGIILFRQQKIERAAVFFEKALQINPAYAVARKNLKISRQTGE